MSASTNNAHFFFLLASVVTTLAGRRKPNPSSVPIIEHSDVKRMLLQQKSYSEGAMMLCLFAASLNSSTDPSDRLLLDFVIPLVKSWPSEWCLEANNGPSRSLEVTATPGISPLSRSTVTTAST